MVHFKWHYTQLPLSIETILNGIIDSIAGALVLQLNAINTIGRLHLLGGDGGDDGGKMVGDGMHLHCRVQHSFGPRNVDVEKVQPIVSSCPVRLDRLLH